MSASERSDRLDELLPDGRKRSIDIGRLDIEVGDEEATFGIETVDRSFDEGVERELLAIFSGGVSWVDIVENVASLEWCSCVVARGCSLLIFGVAVQKQVREVRSTCQQLRTPGVEVGIGLSENG